jgi:integrase
VGQAIDRWPANHAPGSYRQAIQRAAKQAKVSKWFPYQLRHLAATEVRNALGVESAQALLGHSRADMTQHYAQLSEEKAIVAARAAPTVSLDCATQN